MRLISLCSLGLATIVSTVSGLHAQTPALSCHGTQQIRQVAELLFGRDIGRKLGVSEAAWARFVAREITPRFPDGLTVSDVSGQWRDEAQGRDQDRDQGSAQRSAHDDAKGTIVREPAKRVEIVLPGAADDDARLDAVVGAYKREFHQQSVVMIVRPACVSF